MQVFVRQVPCPHSNAKCVADFIALELEKRTPFRRVMRIAGDRISNLDHILGFRLQISGRLNGAEIARIEFIQKGRVPLHTFSSDLDYESIPARTIYGLLGIKIWISLLRNKETTS
jgi:small subunit ribosomal protein S3